MSMSIHAVGYRPPNEAWDLMKAAWNACQNAGVPIPLDVIRFFNDNDPNIVPGVEVPLGDAAHKIEGCGYSGYEISLEKVPYNVRFIRVYNSW